MLGVTISRLACLGIFLLLTLVAYEPLTAEQAVGQAAANEPAPSRELLDRYCVTCHNARLKTAGLSLDTVDLVQVAANAQVLEKVVRKLRGGRMPPAGRPRPAEAMVDAFVASLERALDRAAMIRPNPGRVASRRLNRVEYVNAIEGLLGLQIDGEQLLPSDMAAAGFDNNAEMLSITPSLMARYITAATKISRAAIGSPDNRPIMQVYKVGDERRDVRAGEAMPFATHGGLAVQHMFPLDGEYTFAIRLKRTDTVQTIIGIGEEASDIELRVDRALVKRFTIGGKYPGPDPGSVLAPYEDDVEGRRLHVYRVTADEALEVRVPLRAGQRLVTVAFADSKPSPNPPSELPGIDMVYITGPFDGRVSDDMATRQRIFTCRPTGAGDEAPCAREILTALARRAYRRPVTDADIDPLLGIYREGRRERDFDAGIERALEALLSMPDFLMRVEREPADTQPGSVYRVSDVELASRLSFFLWKSIPDDELLEVAARGELRDPAVLERQVRRMLADRRATRFMNDFVDQWLQIRNLQSHEPDGRLFPSFNNSLRKDMLRETELFFESQVREDRPIPELLRAEYTFLNEQLAEHYGVDDVFGSHFRRVRWTDDRRPGLLGHASVLTATSYADRTSVVLRGKWVLENLLGAPPPPPPPNVPPLEEQDRSNPTSLRERMEQHRANPVCAVCHDQIDPLGFALEHLDAIGRWRETDGGSEINATISLAGETIDSPREFREALLNHGGEFVRTVVEKSLIYALGRQVTYQDAPVVRQLVRDLERDDYRWTTLLLGIVKSQPFQMRRAPNSAETTTVAQP